MVRLLTTVAGVLAAALVGLWTLWRMFRPWMRDAADSLYVRIGEGLRDVSDRLERVEGRARADRAALRKDVGDRLGRMEARILAAMREPGASPPEDSPPPG